MPKQLDANQLMEFAARALSARALSVAEMREKLKSRAVRAGDVEDVVKRLKNAGYLNDQRFAESYATWRRDDGGYGKSRVLRDLFARRVAPAVAKEAVEKAYGQVDEIAMIERFVARKCKGVKNLASAYRKLRAAGFSSGNSLRVLKMDLSFEEDEEEQ